MRYCYKAERNGKGGFVSCLLSAAWDTQRDAALAAKLRYNLPLEKFKMLSAGKPVTHRRVEFSIFVHP